MDADTLIFAYTRQEALANGVLVDVTDTAREVGFKVPVALTGDAWARCVALPRGANRLDETRRLWAVLSTLYGRIRAARDNAGEVRFRLFVLNAWDGGGAAVEFQAVCGPDDDGKPCVTVMTLGED